MLSVSWELQNDSQPCCQFEHAGKVDHAGLVACVGACHRKPCHCDPVISQIDFHFSFQSADGLSLFTDVEKY